jgi:hypothetical protein
MDRLSERWFRLTESIIIIILSFAFFWGTLVYLTHVEDVVSSNATGNDGYPAILMIADFIVDYILFVMPFAVIVIMIRGDKIGDKKRFILRFPLQVLLLFIQAISRA